METMETLCLMEYKVRLSHSKKLIIPLLFCTEFLGEGGKRFSLVRHGKTKKCNCLELVKLITENKLTNKFPLFLFN